MKIVDIELKLESTMAELNRVKNAFISEGRKPTKEEAQMVEGLRQRIKNYEKIREIWLKPEKDNR